MTGRPPPTDHPAVVTDLGGRREDIGTVAPLEVRCGERKSGMRGAVVGFGRIVGDARTVAARGRADGDAVRVTVNDAPLFPFCSGSFLTSAIMG